jgi:hypothetical protein
MRPSRPNSATQVSSMGETPAEARRRMASSGGADGARTEAAPPLGEEVEGPLGPQHIAAIEQAEGGFSGGPVDGGTVEDAPDEIEPPTPSKAMDTIRQLSQDKLQLQTELDAALAKLGRYESKFGELD